MSELLKAIEDKRIEATKSGDTLTRDVLRMVESAISYEGKQKSSQELTDGDIGRIIKREYKKREESIAAAKEAGRDEMVEQETKEREILATILPQEASQEDVEAAVVAYVKEHGADQSAIGVTIGAIVKQFEGKADGAW